MALEEGERTGTIISRALGVLGVEVILAGSPQAKGRVERSFGTAQDLLVKEIPSAEVVVERRLDGDPRFRFGERYLDVEPARQDPATTTAPHAKHAKPRPAPPNPRGGHFYCGLTVENWLLLPDGEIPAGHRLRAYAPPRGSPSRGHLAAPGAPSTLCPSDQSRKLRQARHALDAASLRESGSPPSRVGWRLTRAFCQHLPANHRRHVRRLPTPGGFPPLRCLPAGPLCGNTLLWCGEAPN